MLDPTVQSALVVLVAFVLNWVCQYFNIPLSTEVLASLAAAIVAWLIGTAGGSRVSNSLRAGFRRG